MRYRAYACEQKATPYRKTRQQPGAVKTSQVCIVSGELHNLTWLSDSLVATLYEPIPGETGNNHKAHATTLRGRDIQRVK
jgi:hypothetical protein